MKTTHRAPIAHANTKTPAPTRPVARAQAPTTPTPTTPQRPTPAPATSSQPWPTRVVHSGQDALDLQATMVPGGHGTQTADLVKRHKIATHGKPAR